MKVLFVGDNRCRPNYGCRATSMALYDIIKSHCDVDYTIYGDFTKQYDPILYKGNVSNSRKSKYLEKGLRLFSQILLGKKYEKKDEADFICNDVSKSLDNFNRIFNKYQPLRELYNKIKNVDALIYNAEGTFIFRTYISYELKFELFIVALAQSLCKKTFVVNGMFSDGTGYPRNMDFMKQVRNVLSKCTCVSARDRISYQYYLDNIGKNVMYVPDALFTWKKYINYLPMANRFPLSSLYSPDYQYVAGGANPM